MNPTHYESINVTWAIAKLVNMSTSLNNLQTNVDDLDVGKLKTVTIDLKKLIDVVDDQVVKKIKFNILKTKVNKLDKNISDATVLILISQYNTDKQKLFKNEDVDKKQQTLVDWWPLLILIQKLIKLRNLVKKTNYEAKIWFWF